MRGLIIGVLLALAAAYFIFFTDAGGGKGGIEIMVDEYLESKIELTRANLEALSREVLAYAAEGQGLPESLEALRKFHPTAGSLRDAWGKAFRYERLSEDSFRLRSSGPDGEFETGDDIVKVF
jgi:hypothetical protein